MGIKVEINGYHAYNAHAFIACFLIWYYYDNLLPHLPGLDNLRLWMLDFFLQNWRILLCLPKPCPARLPQVCVFFILTGIKALISRLFVPNWRKFWSYDSITSSNSVLLIIYYMYMNKVGMLQVNGGTNAKSCRDLQRKDNNFFF